MRDLIKPLGRFLAYVPDPLIRAFGQLGMVLVFPTPRSFAECVALLAAPDFPLHQIYNKSGALLLAGNLVDCCCKLSAAKPLSGSWPWVCATLGAGPDWAGGAARPPLVRPPRPWSTRALWAS